MLSTLTLHVQLTRGVVDKGVRRKIHGDIVSCGEEIHQSLLALVRVQLQQQQQEKRKMITYTTGLAIHTNATEVAMEIPLVVLFFTAT